MKINFFKLKKETLRSKLIKDLTYDHGYSMLRSSVSLREHEVLLDISKAYDEYGYMSQQLGEELDSLFLDDDYIIGIHRTGYTSMNEKNLNNIFVEGLINNGHIMSGAMSGTQDIEKTVTLFDDFPILNCQLKAANGYKNSQGCIIVKIPKSYLGRKDGEIKPIYYKKDSTIRLLPEFVYGYIPVSGEGILGEIIHNPNYKDDHNLDNCNLLYEESAMIKARKEGIDLEKEELNLNAKYMVLTKAYEETFIKYGKRQAEHALLSLINKNDVQYFTGGSNRYNLKKYICYDNILKIMCFGLDNLENQDINLIINNFHDQIVKKDSQEKIM